MEMPSFGIDDVAEWWRPSILDLKNASAAFAVDWGFGRREADL